MNRIKYDDGGYIYIARANNAWKIGCTRAGSGYHARRGTHGELAGVYTRLYALRHDFNTPFELVHVMRVPKKIMYFEWALHTKYNDFRWGVRSCLVCLTVRWIGFAVSLASMECR